ncbi:Chromosome segregation ATPase [Salmonella enterica subsp. enterica serovar Typhimurium str. DT104]|nr:Chromosome segregation ATPase [Salmonella enterica subsp. enterica serovar Typhimurium str. DT104]
MYDNLKSLGITNPEEIDRYSLRQEANNDILKIFFKRIEVNSLLKA